MKKYFYIFILQLIIIFYSCSNASLDEQFFCYKKELVNIKQTSLYIQMMQSFRDSLDNWLKLDIKGVRYLKTWKWELSDAVFFNLDKSKCLLLYSAIDPDTLAVFDNVQIVGGEKINNQWHFYIQSYPTNGFNRNELNPIRAHSSNEMIEQVIKNLIEDGYYYKGKCEINYTYIDSKNWFADWIRENHKEFLNNKW